MSIEEIQTRPIITEKDKLVEVIPYTELCDFDRSVRRTWFSNFACDYSLEENYVETEKKSVTKVAGKKRKGVSLKSIRDCIAEVQAKYDEAQKHNVKQSLLKIKRIERVLIAFLENKYKNVNSIACLNISVLDLISKKKTIRTFSDLSKEFKDLYRIDKDAPIDIIKFKDFLDLSNYQMEKEDFMKALLIVNAKNKN